MVAASGLEKDGLLRKMKNCVERDLSATTQRPRVRVGYLRRRFGLEKNCVGIFPIFFLLLFLILLFHIGSRPSISIQYPGINHYHIHDEHSSHRLSDLI